MTLSAADPRRILLVDDEEALAWSLASRLAKARPSDVVETAHDGVSALRCLAAARTDLLIADVRMPGMSGIELILTARAAQKTLPVIVMTAFKSAEVDRVMDGSICGYLEKPFPFERLLDLVDGALSPRTGFSGAISVQTLPEVVQLYVLSGATGALLVRHEDDTGEIFFDRGLIVHARTSRDRGDEAFLAILSWSSGAFSMRSGAIAAERTVRSSFQELVLESCRRADESRRDGPPSKERGWTLTPPPLDDLDFAFAQLDDGASGRTGASPDRYENERDATMNIKDSLAKLNQIDGFVGAALVDSESGMLLGQEGGGSVNLEVAAAGNTEVVRAKRKTMTNLAMKDAIEDILITLGRQYHLIRPLRTRSTLFFYLALDRHRANLAMARIALADVEKDLQV